MSISLHLETVAATKVFRIVGRLDAYGAEQIEPDFDLVEGTNTVIVNARDVTYLSSAGIRILVKLHKRLQARGGRLMFVELQPYFLAVVKMAGLEKEFSIFKSIEAAISESGVAREVHELPCGRLIFQKGTSAPGTVEVLGNIEDVLWARVTIDQMRKKTFSDKAYSLGLGGLGAGVGEVLPIMGEMMTMGGTMVWLPTDGNDTPDFLVPRRDSDQVMIHTGFNVSFPATFNEYVEFEAASPEGATLTELYRALFDLAMAEPSST
jgi:anti-anti-sigma factor